MGYKDRVQVALGAQDLLRAEGAVLVGAAGAGEGAGIHDHRLARGIAVERLGGEGGHDLDRRLRSLRRRSARGSIGGRRLFGFRSLGGFLGDLGHLASLDIPRLGAIGVGLGHLCCALCRLGGRSGLGTPEKRTPLPFLVNARALDGLVSLAPEGGLHETRVSRRLAPALLPLLVTIRTTRAAIAALSFATATPIALVELRHTALLPFK